MTSPSERYTGKQIADTVVVAFHYVVKALESLGYNRRMPVILEVSQKLATTVAIKALDLRLDLRAELGAELAPKSVTPYGNNKTPEPPENPIWPWKNGPWVEQHGEWLGELLSDVPLDVVKKALGGEISTAWRERLNDEVAVFERKMTVEQVKERWASDQG